ncbi:unnamed protein product [Rotaria magnacalcarata]|uniref:RNA methyltransferase n=1 Tax=Rotaria magnacalcarata TaxID=392030 RepID=A0A819K7L2_9BILA|nr:unnamed protein product [Rotaria magnacalcarata]CAF4045373.1 unnamed protein product [Rotaria magnacalcarata]CAF4181448.1 unnamed protein product [Rotaria magnacalcarata]CAF4336083.1 unnamed protein product [Rotaria magnacalcarata]CAF4479283.1 unnamed protein product [Rotaria magnacalcarata]
MATGEDLTNNFFPIMSSSMIPRPIKKQSRIMKKKPARKNQLPIHFRFGGNRKDPLNLNALIEKKKQLAQATTSSGTNNDSIDDGNDRPVEILLQPDIFDPLRLDTSSRNDEDVNNVYSIPSNSTNESNGNKPMIYPVRKKRYEKKRRNIQPPRYGNFQGYYGYRQPNHDQRFQYLEHDWFHNKQVLDVGCHTGHVTFYVAEHFQPEQIVGVDIDQQLIQQARHQLWNRIQTANNSHLNANINNNNNNNNNQNKRYPFNLRFQQENFVLDNDVDLANIKAEYDTIVAFSVTKWVHLNFGDEGLKRFFKRLYRTLLPGGRLILEPQPWSSYRLKRRMTKDITDTYNRIELKPTDFVSYLLSVEVGFETCTTIATPSHMHKGFQRSMLLFIKSSNILEN